jgi:bacterioferritin
MRGNQKVIAHLNDALRAELVAINQYFLHAEMCENWGYHRLSGIVKKQAIDEMKHAEGTIPPGSSSNNCSPTRKSTSISSKPS